MLVIRSGLCFFSVALELVTLLLSVLIVNCYPYIGQSLSILRSLCSSVRKS